MRSETEAHRQQVEDAVTGLLGDAELTPLERLTLVNEIRGWMQQEVMPDAVQAALDAGVGWEDVGGVFGTSKQGAHQQWGRRLAARRLNNK